MSTRRDDGPANDGVAALSSPSLADAAQARESGRLGSTADAAQVHELGHVTWSATAQGLTETAQWGAFTGQGADEARGQGWLEALHPEDRERVAQTWARCVAEGDRFEAAARVRRSDGAYRTLLLRAVPAAGGAGASDWTGFAVDITARAEAEEELRHSAERLRAVVSRAPVVLFAVDRDGVFTLSEGQALAALGLRPGGHVGQSYFALYGDLNDSAAAMRRVLAGSTETTITEYRGRVFETHWTPTVDDHGAVSGVIGVSADITERQRLEQRTQAALDALLAIAETLVQGSEGESHPTGEGTVSASEAVALRLVELTRRVLGGTRASITVRDAATCLSRPLAAVGMSPEDEQAWRSGQPGASLREYLDATQLAQLLAEDVLVVDAPEASERPLPFGVRSCLLAVMRVGGQVVGILSLDHGDAGHTFTAGEVALARAVARLSALVIERERLVGEREEARAREAALRESSRRMDEFLSLVSHELRTPLTGLRGSLQVMQRRLDRAVVEQPGDALPSDLGSALVRLTPFLDRALQQSRALADLVNDLLDVSRIQAGQLQLRYASFDLATVVGQAVEEQCALNPLRQIDARMPVTPVYVVADADRIAQVVTNYLTNALKYSEEDQPVGVGLEVVKGKARVWVRDRGIGISPDDQEHIWDRFGRVESAMHRTGSSVGLGLGLYISRTIIERHGGQVGVKSAPDAGSTFWLTLPLASADA